jgi:zinc protease
MKDVLRKSVLSGSVLLLVVMVLAGCAQTGKPWLNFEIPELNEIKMPAYERVELDNGMVVYLAEDHQLPLVEFSATIDVGSIYEAEEKIGLAGLTGTVMRSGGTPTRAGDDIDELVEARGMQVETWVGNTDGGAYLSVMKEDMGLGMELLADILMHPAFPEDKIKLAKEQVKAGIARRNDDPMSIARREAMKAIFGADHPLARHAEYSTIASINRQDMLDFHADWFHPDRMYLVVIGDFESQAMVELIESSFAGWSGATKALPADPEIPDFPRTVNIVDKDDLTQTTVIMGHKGIRADDPSYAGIRVANRILGGGFATRLFNEVRSRQGLAYTVGSSAGTGYRYPGMFMAFTMTKSESSEKATEAILAEVRRMTLEEVTDEELARAKDGILNSEVFNFDSKREILDRMVRYERYGYEADFLTRYQAEVKAMTRAQVLSAAQAVWDPDKMTIFAVGNYEDWDGDFSSFGPVGMVDITIPEPALEIPAATEASLAAGRELMNAARDAIGGKSLAKMTGYFSRSVMEANIQGMDMAFTFEKSVQYPDRSHTLQKTPFGNMSMVLSGEAGWSVNPGGTEDMDADGVAEAKQDLRIEGLGLFMNLDDMQCQALEPASIDGVACNPVHVSGIGDDYKIIYLRADNNLVFMTQEPGQSPMSGAPVTQKVYIDEYQEFDGLMIAKVSRLLYDDELFGSITVEDFQVNAQLDEQLFVKE